jgi:hypothetical protein
MQVTTIGLDLAKHVLPATLANANLKLTFHLDHSAGADQLAN